MTALEHKILGGFINTCIWLITYHGYLKHLPQEKKNIERWKNILKKYI